MNCPDCGKEMEKGEVEVRDTQSILSNLLRVGAAVTWLPEGERKKIIRKGTVNLSWIAVGYYCKECAKVVAIFEERGSDFFQ